MECKRIQELVGAYLYGDLAPEEMMSVRLHAQQCASCREDIESRGRIVSALPNVVPELSDQERMQIAWSVKGAVRRSRPAFQFGWGHAVTAALVVVAGLAVGATVLMHSPKSSNTRPAPARDAASASVKIEEVTGKDARKGGAQVAAGTQATNDDGRVHRKKRRPTTTETMAQQALRGLAVAGRKKDGDEQRSKTILPDDPATVTDTPEKSEPKPNGEAQQLPKPSDPNNAQTSPDDKTQ